MRILIADDDELSLELLAHVLRQSGYRVTSAHDGAQALELVGTGRFRVVISDWEMPGLSGLDLCREIRRRESPHPIYFMLLTSRSASQDMLAGLNAGADDFLVKPFDPTELRVRLRTAERLLSVESRNLAIFALAKLAESRDPETGLHLERMREYARLVAIELSYWPDFRETIDADYIRTLYMTCPLHDIGKIAIPEGVLLKPSHLTADEYEIMKRHATVGAETLAAAGLDCPDARFLQMAHDLARTHHERFDGAGYPAGLAGEKIPLCGRIAALADTYDALTSDRVYRRAFSHDAARTMIVAERGGQFDPRVVDAFLRVESSVLDVAERFSPPRRIVEPSPGPPSAGAQPLLTQPLTAVANLEAPLEPTPPSQIP